MPDAALTDRDIAAIDIGSNSVRLVLYRLEGRAIWTVYNEKVLAGLGLGFILLNLTVFTQTLAERQFLGIATALTQSLRLVGGLLGTAGMGVLVNLLYSANVQRVFLAANHAEGIAVYADPQTLLHASLDASPWLNLARDALAQSVGVGLLLCAGIGVLALFILYRLPPVRLHVVPATVAPEKPAPENK